MSGNPETPVLGSVFNSVTDQYDPVFGQVNSARQPPFVQLDVRLDKQWVFDRWLLDAYLDLQNATNHTNPEGIAYNYDYTQSKVSAGLPILPVSRPPGGVLDDPALATDPGGRCARPGRGGAARGPRRFATPKPGRAFTSPPVPARTCSAPGTRGSGTAPLRASRTPSTSARC